MIRLSFKNVSVRDSGYGLEVNGKSLEEIISEVLGTRDPNKGGYDKCTGDTYRSNSCDIEVFINPHEVTQKVITDQAEEDLEIYIKKMSEISQIANMAKEDNKDE